MTAPTPEQRAEWRRDFSGVFIECDYGEEMHLALLDALEAAEREREGYRERAIAYARANEDQSARARRAEATLARVEAALDENGYNPYPSDILADIRAALNGTDAP